MNVYGSTYEQTKRQANERVAGKLLEQIEQTAPKTVDSITGTGTGERKVVPSQI
jgi:hypothetical protein